MGTTERAKLPHPEFADKQYTALEAELREAAQGEDAEWLKDPKENAAWEWGPDTMEDGAVERDNTWQSWRRNRSWSPWAP